MTNFIDCGMLDLVYEIVYFFISTTHVGLSNKYTWFAGGSCQ